MVYENILNILIISNTAAQTLKQYHVILFRIVNTQENITTVDECANYLSYHKNGLEVLPRLEVISTRYSTSLTNSYINKTIEINLLKEYLHFQSCCNSFEK